jgi:hypothetical protein
MIIWQSFSMAVSMDATTLLPALSFGQLSVLIRGVFPLFRRFHDPVCLAN